MVSSHEDVGHVQLPRGEGRGEGETSVVQPKFQLVWEAPTKLSRETRIYAELQRQFGDLKMVSFHEPSRPADFRGNFTNPQPLNESFKDDLINWLQAIHQQTEDIVGVDFGHDSVIKLRCVRPILLPSVVIGKGNLGATMLGRIDAFSGDVEMQKVEFATLQIPP